MGEYIHRSVRLENAVSALVRVIREDQQREAEECILLGDLIRREREGWGLSLADLGKRCGLSKAHLWELEQHRAINPSVAALSGLAEALSYPPTKLFEAALESRRVLSEGDRNG